MWLREVVIWWVVTGDGHRGGNRVRVLWVGGGQGGGWYRRGSPIQYFWSLPCMFTDESQSRKQFFPLTFRLNIFVVILSL